MRRLLGTVFATAISLSLAGPVSAEGMAGNYLAGRAAAMHNEFASSAQYYALASVIDRENPQILENAAFAYMAIGDFGVAASLGRLLELLMPGNQIAAMATMTNGLSKGPTDELIEKLAGHDQIGPLVDQLLYAWAQLGMGRTGPAFETFETLIEQEEYRNFGLYHKGLALAMVGDYEGAEAILSGREAGEVSQTRRGAMALAQILGQLGQPEVGMELLSTSFGLSDPVIGSLYDRLASGEPVPFDVIDNAQSGMSEAFYSIAIALNGQADISFTLLYARMAMAVDPRNTDAVLLAANLLDRLEQYELATEAYNTVPRDNPAFLAAELGRAEALRASDKKDTAIEVLTQLTETHPTVPAVFSSLGDTLQETEQWEKAIAAYTESIALRGDIAATDWVVFYTRGIANERSGNWDASEADFRKALELNPGQPNVLNYLGYSLVEKHEKLEEALEMIREAVEARPNSGYITDSLGWALYRLGRFEEAVGPMERAAELEAVDPVVNDHLGDVYWAAGRKREARFQWNRALSFVGRIETSEEVDPDRIRRKLEVGLDVVLEEEGARSLADKAAEAAQAAAERNGNDG